VLTTDTHVRLRKPVLLKASRKRLCGYLGNRNCIKNCIRNCINFTRIAEIEQTNV
jgi:hypothetical protein